MNSTTSPNRTYKLFNEDCLKWFDKYAEENIHLTFIDPPSDRERSIDFLMTISQRRTTGLNRIKCATYTSSNEC